MGAACMFPAISLPVIAVGLITEFEQAEAIVSTGDADFIALARDSVRPALAVARRRSHGRDCRRAKAVSALIASTVSPLV